VKAIEIFAIADPNWRIRNVDTTLDGVTRPLVEKEMPPIMWNSIFENPSPESRAKVYEDFGWHVVRGIFTPTGRALP
jgi:hypothetical protein